MEKYLNPFTDFGFKKLFGEEVNKDLLIDFLNELLREEEGEIKTLTYNKNERLGHSSYERRAIFDLSCTNEKGEKFIVELQRSHQKFFKDRTLYYTTFPIQEQAKQGDWNFELKKIYTIAILDFDLKSDDMDDEPTKYRSNVKLMDTSTFKVFYDKLTLVYLVMPRFNKEVDQLKTRFEKWMYVLKNLSRLQNIPDKLQERIFEKIFKAAEIAKFDKKEYKQYEESLKDYRDFKNSIDTAIEKGRMEGREEGRLEGEQIGLQKGREEGKMEGEQIGLQKGILQIAKNAKQKGMSLEEISEITGMSIKEIENL